MLITAPSSASGLAAELLGYISLFRADRSPGTEGSFELLSSVSQPDSASGPSSVPVAAYPRVVESRDSIQNSFAPCPQSLLRFSSRLGGSSLSGVDRVERAWKAGQWAKAVQVGRIGSPNRTPAIDLRSRFYAVLRAENLAQPTIFQSAASYWRCIGKLEGSDSISQSFPSEVEARIFLQSAGVEDYLVAP